MTLPEDVIFALGRLDPDLARAVVRLSQSLVAAPDTSSAVELSRHHDSAVIVVPPVKALERIRGVTLVPLPDGRALISLDDAMSIFEFEVNLLYALDAEADVPATDRAVMTSVADILKQARQTKDLSLSERSIIVLKAGAQRRFTAPPAPRPSRPLRAR